MGSFPGLFGSELGKDLRRDEWLGLTWHWNVSSNNQPQRLNKLQFQPGGFAYAMVYHWHGHWAMARNGQRKRRRDLNSFCSACLLTDILTFHHLCSYLSPSYFPICLSKILVTSRISWLGVTKENRLVTMGAIWILAQWWWTTFRSNRWMDSY